MASQNDKWVQDMLEKAKEKKNVVPQTRTEGVDRAKIQEMTENLMGFKKKNQQKEVQQ